jgi:hypothetical protein
MVKLDILSDPICPWCYIGKANLDRALERHPDHPFEIEWHPFQLNPDMPAGGVDRRAYLEGSSAGRRTPRASTPGGRGRPRGGARDRLGRDPAGAQHARRAPADPLGGARGAADAGRVGAVPRLLARGARHRRPRRASRHRGGGGARPRRDRSGSTRADADAEDIRARDAHARERGVTGVPTFVVANSHVVPGAQPPELWDQVIGEIAAQLPADGA